MLKRSRKWPPGKDEFYLHVRGRKTDDDDPMTNIACWVHRDRVGIIRALEGLMTLRFSGAWKGTDRESVQTQSERRVATLL